jgi:hypothetical protein
MQHIFVSVPNKIVKLMLEQLYQLLRHFQDKHVHDQLVE